MTDKQPALFDWATELSDAQGHVTLSEQEAHEIGARLRSMGAENETLQAGYAAARLEIESLRAPAGEYPALPDADRDYMRKVVAVAVTMLFDGYKEDVMRVFSTGELSEFVTITAAMGGEQVEDIYRRAWDLLSLPARASHGQAPAQQETFDHGPQATSIEEAARDVGKWLNERPNRPIDLRHVAMLCAHAQAAPQQEPVAWQYRSTGEGGAWWECAKELANKRAAHPEKWEVRCLYTAPQPSPAAQGDALDAARYRFLRDGEWRDTDLEPFIRLQFNTLWDAKIDAARAAQEDKSHDN